MNYILAIPQGNIKAHLDIEHDIQTKKNGLFTFNLRINRGEIEDYAQFETVTIGNYRGIIFSSIEKLTVTYHSGSGNNENAVRPVNSERHGEGWDSAIGKPEYRNQQENPVLTQK